MPIRPDIDLAVPVGYGRANDEQAMALVEELRRRRAIQDAQARSSSMQMEQASERNSVKRQGAGGGQGALGAIFGGGQDRPLGLKALARKEQPRDPLETMARVKAMLDMEASEPEGLFQYDPATGRVRVDSKVSKRRQEAQRRSQALGAQMKAEQERAALGEQLAKVDKMRAEAANLAAQGRFDEATRMTEFANKLANDASARLTDEATETRLREEFEWKKSQDIKGLQQQLAEAKTREAKLEIQKEIERLKAEQADTRATAASGKREPVDAGLSSNRVTAAKTIFFDRADQKLSQAKDSQRSLDEELALDPKQRDEARIAELRAEIAALRAGALSDQKQGIAILQAIDPALIPPDVQAQVQQAQDSERDLRAQQDESERAMLDGLLKQRPGMAADKMRQLYGDQLPPPENIKAMYLRRIAAGEEPPSAAELAFALEDRNPAVAHIALDYFTHIRRLYQEQWSKEPEFQQALAARNTRRAPWLTGNNNGRAVFGASNQAARDRGYQP